MAMGEEIFNMTYKDRRQFTRSMVQANNDLIRLKRHHQAVAERRLMQVFGVGRVKVSIVRAFNDMPHIICV